MADESLRQSKIGSTKQVETQKDNKKIVETPIKKQEKTESEQKVKDKKEEKTEKKKAIKPVVKKDNASVYGRALRISLKQSVGIGNFIKRKDIDSAIKDLEMVLIKKKAIPFTGEMAHKKGKGMMTGKYPVNSSKEFIMLLKSLKSNSIANGMDLDKTVISEVIANKAPNQFHRFGQEKFKRTHVLIKSKEKKTNESK